MSRSFTGLRSYAWITTSLSIKSLTFTNLSWWPVVLLLEFPAHSAPNLTDPYYISLKLVLFSKEMRLLTPLMNTVPYLQSSLLSLIKHFPVQDALFEMRGGNKHAFYWYLVWLTLPDLFICGQILVMGVQSPTCMDLWVVDGVIKEGIKSLKDLLTGDPGVILDTTKGIFWSTPP